VKAGLGTRITDSGGKLIKAVAHRIPHDFRRTAVRNLERARVPRSAAIELVGHKTMAIYSRYAICDESMLKDTAAKLEILHHKIPWVKHGPSSAWHPARQGLASAAEGLGVFP
jgi:integrase